MAPLARSNTPGNPVLPYQVSLGLTAGLLLVTIVLLILTFHRLHKALFTNTVLSQFSARLRKFLEERDEIIAGLEMMLHDRDTINPNLFRNTEQDPADPADFVVGEDSGDSDKDDERTSATTAKAATMPTPTPPKPTPGPETKASGD